MATYFHGSSEFQGGIAVSDGMQTLYLMNPNYESYSDTHQPATAANMFFLNPAVNVSNTASLSHAPPSNHNQFLGLPLPSPTPPIGPSSLDDPNRPSPLVSGVCHNLWGSCIHQQNSQPGSSSNPQLVSVASSADTLGGPRDIVSQLGLRRSGVSPRQGLSLSLSSQQLPFRSSNVETVINGQPEVQTTSLPADDLKIPGSSPSTVSVVSNGIAGVQSVVFGSKYLTAAQELLYEVVNVGQGLKIDPAEGTKAKTTVNKESKDDVTGGEGSSAGEKGDKPGPELTTVQRQEIQMKKAKLVSMLDEVEQRYRQYHHQMQAVVVSFEQAAGFGAAKAYTALALQTISKQFRCLKDAISGQIKATSKSLGEEDCLGAKVEGSRLRYVDHQLRQQRALQQMGMIQHSNAWRPQRGLPERAVCVLRAWLFEHFLHPYPKDSDKHMLAKQTGLTRSQVSNWFINARVRLWKPMVEEMYMEEVKEQQERTNGGQQKESGSSSSAQTMEQVKAQSKPKSINHNNNNNNTSPSDQFSNSTISTSRFWPSGLDGAAQTSPKRPRNELPNSRIGIVPREMDMKQGETREINMKLGDERLFKEGYSYLGGSVYGSMQEIGRFDAEQQQLPPGFNGNGGVSLTLGLPHCENLSLSGNRQNFVANHSINQVGRMLELGASESDIYGINAQQQASHPSDIEIQNRKRFAAPLLPDFVV
ncbi:BEL1-like homeodomain 1, embryo sac development arrest 29 [Hibiscus trionum]|uniref:BEL1-like homeodomain 1, embryo sac development arrest 29 n=1 Tax=Hibiscus trionum TaxID=183268 RepID=A0A9W7HQC3_HIBTR|nr:BEL1-like homeodomain 1, embryo sac development arrest 29 [Hibiscus trionum]